MDEKAGAKPFSECGVLIAGGTSGVGLASAIGFAREGVRGIVLLGRDTERGAQAVTSVLAAVPNASVSFISADACDIADITRAAEAARATLGSIDILVNSTASNYAPDLLMRTAIEEISGIFDRLVLPPIYLTRVVLPWMREQKSGSIINMASDAAKTATPGETIAGAGMAAIVMFSRTLAMEAKRDGIRVNVLTPSLIAGTPTAELVTGGGFSAKLFEKAAAMAHLGVAVPEDLADMVVFLGGPQSARLTGQAISINGGISAA